MIYSNESTIIYNLSTRIDGMTISKRITEAREHAGLSKTALASACKISKQAIGQMENGSTKNPQPITLKKIAYACRVSLNWLIDGEGSMLSSNLEEIATENKSANGSINENISKYQPASLLASLKGKITPQTMVVLERLAKIDTEQGLSEQDINILKAIIERYEAK